MTASNNSERPDVKSETLKSILETAGSPQDLDGHPWASSLLVEDALADQPELRQVRPGRRLLLAITKLFSETMPSVPPRRGLRLDTRWGEFGMLAARYFAPLKYGLPFPTSMRDAWGRIDHAILLFVYGHADGSLLPSEVARYRLVGGEQDVAPESTLSDWHRKGLQRLAARIQEYQMRLEHAAPGPPLKPARYSVSPGKQTLRRALQITAGALLVLILAFGAVRAYRVYLLAEKVRADLRALENAVPASPSSQALLDLSSQLPAFHKDLVSLEAQARPFLWLGPILSWVPTYGGDLAQARDLLDLAVGLTASADKGSQALSPLLDPSSSASSELSLSAAVGYLSQAEPQLSEARQDFTVAQAAREHIQPDRLSPQVRDLLTQSVDPAMSWMGDGLSLSMALPTVLGAGADGPKTYLLVAQNEDELRPTGGFITAIGKLVLDQGHVVDLSFENSGDLDNWSMPYPMAPWQLQEYMNSSVLIVRDANWFPDFPTAVLYIKQMYAYTHQGSVNGVIAFDQQMLVTLLKAVGSVQVEGVDYPITASNVTEYMHEAKVAPVGEPLPPGWTYKAFVGTLAQALVNKMLSSQSLEWRSLSLVVLQAFEQRHLLIQLDQPDAQAVLARRDWNGALSASPGDFLTVLDSNVGFNKTNAVVKTQLSYSVDLTDLSAPASELLVSHSNGASADVPCVQWNEGEITAERIYPIDRCY